MAINKTQLVVICLSLFMKNEEIEKRVRWNFETKTTNEKVRLIKKVLKRSHWFEAVQKYSHQGDAKCSEN